ncbi:MAG: cob(I)yrinic acid a,c-diamide adenosyltransferase [Ardenticatenaceae bacterium]|nr:cob(I)yrinic acid a,c-diamide adenosyltransferase [Ardenticatenaceae bacterium]HBY96486.1 cob(I)yrinic acid a,c-diamide adenosyltransferase [Chloroflexota bacterium]
MAWPGDFGYADLLDQKQVPKYDLRFEVLGTLDEVSSVLGVVRPLTTREETKTLIVQIQRDLCWMMSELAATTDGARPCIYITPERSDWLADVMEELRAKVSLDPHFIVPGDSASGGFLQLARAVTRRAERLVTLLNHQGGLHNGQIIAYLNRLSAVLYVLGRYEDQMAGVQKATLARPPRE